MALASASAPFMINKLQAQALPSGLFNIPEQFEDRILVIISLNGGNDGLNTIIPIDQYDNLVIQRPNILIPENQILYGDFFEHEGSYDLIIEQTFFCAIKPQLRQKYVLKCHELLNPNGKLLGVLFNREFEGGPPFGGSVEVYERLFKSQFSVVNVEECQYSIKPRIGNEVIINCKK